MKIGFIGLGNMGSGMANNLVADRHEVYTYDINVQAFDRVPGGIRCESIAEVISKCDNVLFLSLTDPPAERDVFFGPDKIFAHSKAGLIFVDTTTSMPSLSKEIASKARERKMYFLEASVSGGVKGVAARTLTIFAGGDKEAYQTVFPIIENLSKKVYYFENVGTGLTVKLINNMVALSNVVTLIEALNLGAKAGLDPKMLLEMIGLSSGNSNMLQSQGTHILARDFVPPGFALSLGLKDLTLACSLAEELDSPLFMGSAAQRLLTMGKERGFGTEDVNSVIKVYEEISK